MFARSRGMPVMSENLSSADRVVRFRDACDEVGVTPLTMRRWIAAGRGPRLVRLSARIHGFRRGDLDAWIESRTSAA